MSFLFSVFVKHVINAGHPLL